ncbi:MAG: ClbS/DfsB family four-helix bundle protein [candidate division Zixibacteria bacterium]|nr:ClbS/DfsB family four-helix bundle protein [candidate division Zixibacteria bacterium]
MHVTEVVERANKSFNKLIETIESISSQEQAAPKAIGQWSVKDILNHITIWEEEAAKAFEIWKVGIEPDWSHIADLDIFNDETVKQRRKMPLAKIKDQLQLIHNGVIENLKSVPDEVFIKRGGVPKWLITLLTSHIEEHAVKIMDYIKSLESARHKSA